MNTQTQEAKSPSSMGLVSWLLSLAVGGFLIVFGITKFTGGAHIFPLIEMKATALGFPMADLFYPLVNYATGTLEIVAGILVILPMTRQRIGAPLAVVPFLGAFVFHLSPLLGIKVPAGYTILEANAANAVAAGSRPVDAALAAGSGFQPEHFQGPDTYALFGLATLFLVLAILNALLHRRLAA